MTSFFGTDGIRGQTTLEDMNESDAITSLLENRQLHPHIFRLLGEAIGLNIDLFSGEGSTVIIGWDERPANDQFAKQLTIGLRLYGCEIIHAPITSTPVLHGLVLENNARLGCMITASHNPVSDTGVKLFDAHGMKTLPERETYLSNVMIQLSAEERPVEDEDVKELSKPKRNIKQLESAEFHQQWLLHRIQHWTSYSTQASDLRIHNPLKVDSSRGSAHVWLSDFLERLGYPSEEVSSSANALNEQCGAGELSPGDFWTIEEAKMSHHALIQSLEHTHPRTIVGVAIDGDGDRCFLIETTEGGFRVLDGDMMVSMILQHHSHMNWLVATSIESDLEFVQFISNVNHQNKAVETAVGDRWLGHMLMPRIDDCSSQFEVLGVEDSGHLVMASSTLNQRRSLVGDGIATMLRCLQFGTQLPAFPRGQKQRISISNPHRSRWNPESELFDVCLRTCIQMLSHQGFETLQRTIEGESSLLFIEFSNQDGHGTIGIRNSGTQEKTNLSIRLSQGLDMNTIKPLVEQLQSILIDGFD